MRRAFERKSEMYLLDRKPIMTAVINEPINPEIIPKTMEEYSNKNQSNSSGFPKTLLKETSYNLIPT
ncbi:hypothetical protein BK003_00325 [bacterium CG09_39_24]|nr:MAG: hypothetical protein BK003_00325 [bacterium CG09_39_24]